MAMEKGARHEVSKPEHEVIVRYQLEPSTFQYVREQLGKRFRVKLDETPDLRVVVKYLAEDSDLPPF